MEAWAPDLSRDGRKLAFLALRGGRWELWEKSLLDEREAPVVSGAYVPFSWVRWSRDGTRLAFNVWGIRFNPVRGRPLGEPFRVTSFESPA